MQLHTIPWHALGSVHNDVNRQLAQALHTQPVPWYVTMLGGKLDFWCNRGKNDFLGTAYIAVGAICMALALVRPTPIFQTRILNLFDIDLCSSIVVNCWIAQSDSAGVPCHAPYSSSKAGRSSVPWLQQMRFQCSTNAVARKAYHNWKFSNQAELARCCFP